jgi:hypothetical protein
MKRHVSHSNACQKFVFNDILGMVTTPVPTVTTPVLAVNEQNLSSNVEMSAEEDQGLSEPRKSRSYVQTVA